MPALYFISKPWPPRLCALEIFDDALFWADKFDIETGQFLDPAMDPEVRAEADRAKGGTATPWDYPVPKGWQPRNPEWMKFAPSWWLTEQKKLSS
jgi:hypothetical protein